MNKILLLISGLLLLMVSSVVAQDLKEFKVGKFTYEGKEDEVLIIRTKTKQTEIYNGGKSRIYMKIDWLNEYTYLLTATKVVDAPGCMGNGDWIRTKVVSVEGNRYLCSYTTQKCGDGKCVIVKLK